MSDEVRDEVSEIRGFGTGSNLFRIDSDGQVSVVGGGISPGDGVYSLQQRGGALYIGGGFTEAGNASANNVALWQIPQMLAVKRAKDSVQISWPAADSNFALESTGSLPVSNWATVAQTPTVFQARLTVTNQIRPTNQFFRLQEKNAP